MLGIERDNNIGISTNGFLAVDIDMKEGKDGESEIQRMEKEGKEFPQTFEQYTPTGGRHLIYSSPTRAGNSTCKLAPGVDIRGWGGQLVGAGSTIDGKSYTANWAKIQPAPQWLEDLVQSVRKLETRRSDLPAVGVDESYARKRGEAYLSTLPGARSGEGGNHASFAACATLRDLGCNIMDAHDLMEKWNEKCEPPWSIEELTTIVNNAYSYANDRVGNASPEAVFDEIPVEEKPKVLHPFDELNKEFAYVLSGSSHHILRETVDPKGIPCIKHIEESTFHTLFPWKKMKVGDKSLPVTKQWMHSRDRRSYLGGFCFAPGRDAPPGYYNLFRGWTVEPWPHPADHPIPKEWAWAVDAFLSHIRDNICEGDNFLFQWILGFFAHLIQRPYQKPHVALVFRGKKGVGKSAILDRIGAILGAHYLATADQRYLTGNFNSHLENCLLLVLEEAFWSGDKKADGILKNLVTGSQHVIERKGKEAYSVDNCTRIVIIGNDEWLVPASEDERRYAVFDVGSRRQNDSYFFQRMREGMEQGGYRVLLRYLQDFDLSKVNLNAAPKTQALLEQKFKSLRNDERWWFDCLHDGHILHSNFPDHEMPEAISKEDLRNSYSTYLREAGIRARTPDHRFFGRRLQAFCPSMHVSKILLGDKRVNAYKLPGLEKMRTDFSKYIGQPISWEET